MSRVMGLVCGSICSSALKTMNELIPCDTEIDTNEPDVVFNSRAKDCNKPVMELTSSK